MQHTQVLLHGDETTAHGDRGYADKSREPDRERGENEVGPRWFVPFKRRKGCDTTPEQKRLNRLMSGLRSAVEHPFRVLKRQFGYTKVRYRGLFKNEQHLFSQWITFFTPSLARQLPLAARTVPGWRKEAR